MASIYDSQKGQRPADFRSDTLTKPSPEMRAAMASAVVGDDVYGEDPTVNALQTRVAGLLGKEAALFVPSGTMSNLLALACWGERGEEVIAGEEQHIICYEQGGASALFSLVYHTLPQLPNGTFALTGGRGSLEYALKVRGGGVDPHFSRPAVVAIEQTHNRCGGALLPQPWVEAAAAATHAAGLKFHVDGARLFNAVVASGQSAAALVACADSVSVCLSKGLGAPIGSVLVGPAPFIARARRLRKRVGGGMRPAGVLAAAGLCALENVGRLRLDHSNAAVFAKALTGMKGMVIPGSVDSNLVIWELDPAVLSVAAFAGKSLPKGHPAEGVQAGCAGGDLSIVFGALVGVLGPAKVSAYGGVRLRAVMHMDVGEAEVATLIRGAQAAAALMTA